ncbi:hypothetical protein D3C84_811140 [compost metagenome]
MGRSLVPFGQVRVNECLEWAFLSEQFGADDFHLGACSLQGLFYQLILGLEMRIEAAVSQAQRFHQGLQAGRANTVAAKSR